MDEQTTGDCADAVSSTEFGQTVLQRVEHRPSGSGTTERRCLEHGARGLGNLRRPISLLTLNTQGLWPNDGQQDAQRDACPIDAAS